MIAARQIGITTLTRVAYIEPDSASRGTVDSRLRDLVLVPRSILCGWRRLLDREYGKLFIQVIYSDHHLDRLLS